MFRAGTKTPGELLHSIVRRLYRIFTIVAAFAVLWVNSSYAQSLDLPSHSYGVSFGNSRRFNGLRFNISDGAVEIINGVNITLYRSHDNKNATVNGVSLGLVGPEAGCLEGIQIGGLGVSAEKELRGVSLGLLGAGSGGRIHGITLGGLGVGAGGDIRGFTFGVLGAGAGKDIWGITIGGLGAGAGRNLTGITVAGLGAGTGGNITGITIGGLGAGAGNSIHGFTAGLLGAGAGGSITGITIGGLGAGCGQTLRGITLAGLGVGSPEIRGIACAAGMVKSDEINEKEGKLTGCCISAINKIEGNVHGISLGIVNYAYSLKGIQIGVINYVRDNPRYLKILPIINVNAR